ncbi:DUF1885 family protein [Halalkalibacterium ligniniphilum]|uniref:DUF1885 family protein n=1 Tax=Halalkalibacterium ligniniphilum TaxID=1134413 RepID=UPI0003449D3E|nr:DUF1885 family protein [Halalkalibacterium ligniniphilum]
MSSHALIQIPQPTEPMTVELVKSQLERYQHMTIKTGNQLDWEYKEAAFPYKIVPLEGQENDAFYLKGMNPLYRYIVFAIENEATQNENEEIITSKSIIHVYLVDSSTHGDKGKAIEFCKFLGKQFKGAVHLYNGRVLRY